MLTLLLLLADTPRPDSDELNKIFDKKIECTRQASHAVDRLTTGLTHRLSNRGSAVSVQCTLPDNPTFDWFLSRDRLSEIDFFYEVFRNKGFRKAVKEDAKNLIPAKANRQFTPKRQRYIAESGIGRGTGEAVKEDRFGFELKSCFTQTGMLAADIFHASPDTVHLETVHLDTQTHAAPSADPVASDGEQAMTIAVDAANAMLGSDYATGLCYLSRAAYAPWFKSISSDRTYVYINKSKREATFIFLTQGE